MSTTNRKGSTSGHFAVTNSKKRPIWNSKKGHSSDRRTSVCGIIKTIDSKIWSVAWLVVRAVNFEQITTDHLIGRFCGFCGRTTCLRRPSPSPLLVHCGTPLVKRVIVDRIISNNEQTSLVLALLLLWNQLITMGHGSCNVGTLISRYQVCLISQKAK